MRGKPSKKSKKISIVSIFNITISLAIFIFLTIYLPLQRSQQKLFKEGKHTGLFALRCLL
jgi:hypothetical protein